MDPTYLRLIIDYNYWARDRLLDAVAVLSPEQLNQNLGSSFPSIRETLVHLYAAEWVWYQRWQGTSPTSLISSDQFPDLATLRAAWVEHEAKVRAFGDGLDDYASNRVYEYRLLKGTPGSSPMWQMVAHLVNHGTYHRGQVTTMLRQLGAAPPKSIDMIEFFRTRQAELRQP
jgi:uncharacterized damage-inducible protein DinB